MVFFRKSKAFEGLITQTSIMMEAVEIFKRIVDDMNNLKEGCAALKELEVKADEVVHEISEDIEKVFILPLDKDDIKRLSEYLDDIVDNLEQIANRLNIYGIRETNQALKDFYSLVLQSAQRVRDGILMIKERKIASKDFYSLITDLHELEDRGDKLHRGILEEMIGRGSSKYGKDPISIIKWKEIFQTLEDTLDKFEDFAVIFGILRVKYM